MKHVPLHVTEEVSVQTDQSYAEEKKNFFEWKFNQEYLSLQALKA